MQAKGYLRFKSGRDIRGCASEGDEREAALTTTVAERIGYAFALFLARRLSVTPDKLTIAVGRDARASGTALMQAVVHGLVAADCDVLDCGLCTAPALTMTRALPGAQADGAVMVTASHHPWYFNGFKLTARDGDLSEEEIAQVLLEAERTPPAMRLVKQVDLMEQYRDSLRQMVQRQLQTDVQCPLLGLHVVVDAGGGAGGFYADFLEELGCEVTGSRGLEPDGHAPRDEGFANPGALKALSDTVLENTADIGVMVDADCDRVLIVDEEGRVIARNSMIALVAAIMLTEEPGLTFVTDSESSSGLQRFITEWGGVHYRFKRGYHVVVDEARRLNEEGIDCPLAIETSGHAAFRENAFVDDGVYLATWLLCEALQRKRDGETLDSLLEGLSEPIERTQVRMAVCTDDCHQAIQSVIEMILSNTLENPAWHLARDNREGVRILFDLEGGVENAWFQIRMSVHDPVMVLSAESDVPGGVRHILTQLYELLREEDEIDLEPLATAIR